MNTPTFQRLSREALEEHEQVHFFFDQLRNALDALDVRSEDLEPMRRLAVQIGSLRDRLEEHFSSEENGGLYQGILEIIPEARAEVRRLTSEHERMNEILELARIHAERAGPGEIEALRDDLHEFLEMMRNHEKVEARLVRRALGRESRAGEGPR